MTTVRFEALRAFRAVAQHQSYTAAARAMRADKAQVSRAVQALERELHVTLFARSTRSVRLTREGEVLLAKVAPLLAGLESALEPTESSAPTGEVTLSATPDVAQELLAPLLAGFRLRYPLVRVRLHTGNALADLTRDGVELALRIGRPGPASLVARKVLDVTAGFFASPAYLARRGVPLALTELSAHETLWPAAERGRSAFRGLGAVPASLASSDFNVLRELARSGAGIAFLPSFFAARDVANGALVRVLPEFAPESAPLFLVSGAVRGLPERVRVLRAYLLEHLAR